MGAGLGRISSGHERLRRAQLLRDAYVDPFAGSTPDFMRATWADPPTGECHCMGIPSRRHIHVRSRDSGQILLLLLHLLP
jgi:hypothetical protein